MCGDPRCFCFCTRCTFCTPTLLFHKTHNLSRHNTHTQTWLVQSKQASTYSNTNDPTPGFYKSSLQHPPTDTSTAIAITSITNQPRGTPQQQPLNQQTSKIPCSSQPTPPCTGHTTLVAMQIDNRPCQAYLHGVGWVDQAGRSAPLPSPAQWTTTVCQTGTQR